MTNEIEMCLCGTEVRLDKNNVCPVCGRQYDGDEVIENGMTTKECGER